jgi:hypothetical protein
VQPGRGGCTHFGRHACAGGHVRRGAVGAECGQGGLAPRAPCRLELARPGFGGPGGPSCCPSSPSSCRWRPSSGGGDRRHRAAAVCPASTTRPACPLHHACSGVVTHLRLVASLAWSNSKPRVSIVCIASHLLGAYSEVSSARSCSRPGLLPFFPCLLQSPSTAMHRILCNSGSSPTSMSLSLPPDSAKATAPLVGARDLPALGQLAS